MNGPRKLHNATLLPDGKVLVTGGSKSVQGPNQESTDPPTLRKCGIRQLALGRPWHRAPVAGRPRFIRRRQREKDRRNIFAALSVQWRTSNYLFGADRSWLRTIIFRRHSGRDKYYKRDDDCALPSNTQLQHEPAYHSPLFLAR